MPLMFLIALDALDRIVVALIKAYLDPTSTSLFKTRAAETQRTQRNILESLAAKHGDYPGAPIVEIL
jgi:hypothetical protein